MVVFFLCRGPDVCSLPLDVMKGLEMAARLCQYDIRLSMVTSLTMLLSPRTDAATNAEASGVPPKFSLLDGTSSRARDIHLCTTILPLVCGTLRFVIESEPGLLGQWAASVLWLLAQQADFLARTTPIAFWFLRSFAAALCRWCWIDRRFPTRGRPL